MPAALAHAATWRNASIVRKGSWIGATSTSAYKSTVSGSTQAGARLTLTFTGRGVAVVGSTGPNRGKANIYIDGVAISSISTRSRTNHSRRVLFMRYLPAGGTHTITFESTGAWATPLVRLDAFVVLK